MEIELRYGKHNIDDYNGILEQFSGSKINSLKTSTIPLVQFWKPTSKRLDYLFNNLNLQCEKPILSFEHPTKPKSGKGKASMTDLMIICDDFNIAIEAKFTEYVNRTEKSIDKWKSEGNLKNKNLVLGYWTSLIEPFSNGLESISIKEISYQFFHRTASACNTIGSAIVIYQLFYDNYSLRFLEIYKNKIKDYINIINPNKDKLNFYIWEIEANQLIGSDCINPYKEMIHKEIFEFPKIVIEQI